MVEKPNHPWRRRRCLSLRYHGSVRFHSTPPRSMPEADGSVLIGEVLTGQDGVRNTFRQVTLPPPLPPPMPPPPMDGGRAKIVLRFRNGRRTHGHSLGREPPAAGARVLARPPAGIPTSIARSLFFAFFFASFKVAQIESSFILFFSFSVMSEN